MLSRFGGFAHAENKGRGVHCGPRESKFLICFCDYIAERLENLPELLSTGGLMPVSLKHGCRWGRLDLHQYIVSVGGERKDRLRVHLSEGQMCC